MNSSKNLLTLFLSGMLLLNVASCTFDKTISTIATDKNEIADDVNVKKNGVVKPLVPPQKFYQVERTVTAGGYFDFIDNLLVHLDTTNAHELDEYVVMRANPWLIDRLANTDYYITAAEGKYIEDPKSIEILSPGDSLLIPNIEQTNALLERMANTVIDVNIPEFKLWIKEGDAILHEANVRVGKNTQRFLAMAGRDVDLRTHPGVGTITRIARDPAYINPRNNKRYKVTKRDDGKVTQMPRIPWLEPTIGGRRLGQLIHPTTNLATLGKAYSNGCVGTSEATAWYIYFHAPIGTKVQFRYDLEVIEESGDTTKLKDIYPGFKATKKVYPVYADVNSSFLKKLFSKKEETFDAGDVCYCDVGSIL